MARKDGKDRGLFSYRDATGREYFGVRIWVHGRAHKWQGFTKKTDARDWYQDRRKDIRENRPFPPRGHAIGPSLSAVIEHYLVQCLNKKNLAGERVYGRFWSARLGHLSPGDITPEHVNKSRTHLLTVGNGRGPLGHSTVNRYVSWLHHVFQIELELGKLKTNPCIMRLQFEEPKAPEVEFTDEEELALARELGEHADYPSFAILTGLRQGEQFGLRWRDLDLERGYGKLHSPKGGSPEVFLLNDAAKAILGRLKIAAGTSEWVFPQRRNFLLPINPKTWYNRVFKPAALRAGIQLSRKHGKTFHTLRHTFASRLQQQGVEVKDIKDLGRWKTWRAMDRYLKRDHARLRASIEKLRIAPKPPVDEEDVS